MRVCGPARNASHTLNSGCQAVTDNKVIDGAGIAAVGPADTGAELVGWAQEVRVDRRREASLEQNLGADVKVPCDDEEVPLLRT